MKNKFVYIWGVLLLLALIGIGCIIYKYNKEGKGMDGPQRLRIGGVVTAVDDDILEIKVTSEDGDIKQGEVINVKIPNEDQEEGFVVGDEIKIYYFIPCNYIEGQIWEPHQVVK